MASAAVPFPRFDRPPVVETVLGVEFVPIEGWALPHFGLFWNELRADYPKTEMVPALPSMIEEFGREATYQPQSVEFTVIKGEPPVRAWFVDDSSGKLLQIQRDRLIHNWRKTGPNTKYPGYEATKRMFITSWTKFTEFLKAQQLRLPDVTQSEVTYINHVERGVGWNSLADLPRVTPFLTGKGSSGFLHDPEVVVLTARYLMPEQLGRLHVSLQPAFRTADEKEILQLQLTARGKPRSSATDDVVAWMELGHEWVVKGFADMTSSDMHNIWDRKQ